MTFPVTFTGQITFQDKGDSSIVTNFIKLVERDLELAHANKVLGSFSVEENAVTFKLASISRRFLSHPLGYLSLYFHPKNYREFILSLTTISNGKVSVTSNLQTIVVAYTLNFSEVFKWTLFMFVAGVFLGLFALAWETRILVFLVGFGILAFFTFGHYFSGVVVALVMMRRYLKKRIEEGLKGTAFQPGER